MKAFELGKKSSMKKMDPLQQRFTAKMIMNEVAKIAKEYNISEEAAYNAYMHGLYGGDREIGGEDE
jgi:hypothetical protein